MKSNESTDDIVRRVMDLRIEHRDLDDAIIALSKENYIDQLQLKRLKTRKLKIKDEINQLSSNLIPDVDA